MDPRQAELSRNIDRDVLGERIRHARVAAGMTQGELGKAVGLSTAYISRIEAGDRRPEASRLEAMALALRVALDSLIAPEAPASLAPDLRFKLDHAQLALSAGSVDEAYSVATELLGELEGVRSTESARWQAELVVAQCHEARGDLDQAIVWLERIAETPRQDAVWIKVLIALSRCYREAGDTARAIAVGENASSMLQEMGLSQVTEAVQLALTVAAAYSVQGDVDHAARICMRAIDEAAAIGSPVAQGSAYWNASIMESRRGFASSAVQLAARAVALFEMADDRRNMARLRTELALLQLDTDPPALDEAWANVEQARAELEWSSATPSDRGTNRLIAARVLDAKGATRDALEMVDGILSGEGDLTPMLAAEVRVSRGQFLVGLGEMDAGLESYRSAVMIASSIGADRDAGQFWFNLADLLDAAGDHEAARDAYRRAASSVGLTTRRARQLR